MTADMDLTAFLPVIKAQKVSFTAAIMYLIAWCANDIPEFKHRVRDDDPIEHDVVHPSTTILTKDELFTFCTLEYKPNFWDFIRSAEEEIATVKAQHVLEEKFSDDRMLFMTSIPWVSFTSFMHPIRLNPADSVPRFAWGKFHGDSKKIIMPLSVQGHHAVMDGLHAGRFFETFQSRLSLPETILSNK
jgi:chloramphenicol O-acetyltransferase type A